MKEVIRRVSGEDCEIVGASRTDSGAHAEGQVCHFDTSVPIPIEKWKRVLNQVLPGDVRIREARKVSEKFNSRFSALDRQYRYVFRTSGPDPRAERYALAVRGKLNLSAMRAAATLLEGEHDFKAFTEDLSKEIRNTKRVVFKASVWKNADNVHFDVVGTAFLKGMMRRMAGALLEIGQAKRPVSDIESLLDPKSSNKVHWPVVLPAKGLTLMRVRYGPHPRDNRDRSEQSDE